MSSRKFKIVTRIAMSLTGFIVATLCAIGFSPPTQAVIDGTIAGTNFNAQVYIDVTGGEKCTGTLISRRWVLTAKHCLNGSQRGAAVATLLNTELRVGNRQRAHGDRHVPSRIVLHPALDVDVALIELSHETFPYRSIAEWGIYVPHLGAFLVSGGWGITSEGSRNSSDFLKMALYIKGVLPNPLTTAIPVGADIYMYPSSQGELALGDSGAGVFNLSLLCGVFTSTTRYGPHIAFARSTDSISAWIVATSGVLPSEKRSCELPNKKIKKNPLFNLDVGKLHVLIPQGMGSIISRSLDEDAAFNLKVMPLGASITEGVASSDKNGYRYKLFTELGSGEYIKRPGVAAIDSLTDSLQGEFTSGQVDFVGRKRNGSSPDPDNEGWPGFRIDDVMKVASCAVPYYHPNLVTLVVGTNDVLQNHALSTAPQRLHDLIDQILTESPRATVLVSNIPPNTDTKHPEFDVNTTAYNAAIPGVVASLVAAGKHVIFSPAAFTRDLVSPDHVHPTNNGYSYYAAAFLNGAYEAIANGWIQEPEGPGVLRAGCSGASGSPTDPRWEDHGVSFKNGFGKGKSHRWGDVNGDHLPELFVVNHDQSWTFYWNSGRTNTGWTGWVKGVTRGASRPGLVGNALRFADMDHDGHTDCVTVDLLGHMTISVWDEAKPVGKKICGKKVTTDVDVHEAGKIPADSRIDLQDLNADGFPDYLITDRYGATRAWLQYPLPLLSPSRKRYLRWTSLGEVVPRSSSEPHEFRWADLNGDGGADLILITKKGGANAWINQAFTQEGRLKLHNIGNIADDKNVPPQDVDFVDVGGNGRADFVRVGWTGVIHIWLNRLNGL